MAATQSLELEWETKIFSLQSKSSSSSSCYRDHVIIGHMSCYQITMPEWGTRMIIMMPVKNYDHPYSISIIII